MKRKGRVPYDDLEGPLVPIICTCMVVIIIALMGLVWMGEL